MSIVANLIMVSVCAAQPFLVSEINTQPGGGSSPSYISKLDRVVLFFARDGVVGNELWRSNGTPGGTNLVLDITPGPDGTKLVEEPVSLNGDLYFVVDAGDDRQLWKSDGTTPGTILLRDLNAGGNDEISSLVIFEDALYFIASDGSHGIEPWTSDGTAEGTIILKDIKPGPGGSTEGIVNAGTKLFLNGDDGIHGSELWQSDGTSVGTTLVADIRVGPSIGVGKISGAGNGLVFFAANDGITGAEPWRSDGTSEGTYLLRDINEDTDGLVPFHSLPQYFQVLGDRVVFNALTQQTGIEPWVSDGKRPIIGTNGTHLLKDINPDPFSFVTGNSMPYSFIALGNKVCFVAATQPGSSSLWVTDGTSEGTLVLTQSATLYHTDIQGTLYFSGSDTFYGSELFTSDGTPEGTGLAFHINSSGGSGPGEFEHADGLLYFAASDYRGRELWALNIAPWVESIEPTGPSPTDAETVDFVVTFNERVSGVNAPDFELLTEGVVNASVAGVISEDGGRRRRVTVNTGEGPGTIRLKLSDDDSIVDVYEGLKLRGYGTPVGDFTGERGYTTDPNPPSTQLSSTAVSPVRSRNIVFEVTFNRSVVNFSEADIAITNGTVSGFTGSGSGYSFAVHPSSLGAFTVQVPAAVAEDFGGVPNDASELVTLEYLPSHAADINHNNSIDFSELLRLIQLYNLLTFHCDESGEDGYGAGLGDQSCEAHSSDYAPLDWTIGLSELLRGIQLFNIGTYHACADGEESEDGYCAGPAA